ncbi:Formamidopyrimidine-DNA glycosylase N-terminal domain-containing protein [Mycena maculata]|uniref:Formamidopyrimidine-DNA glycosylase N-terminal domain-containing protein n=1 Tax=Mycena maculata TaxID=230809 RepID=A0AAD7ITI0_9AGAR|nr:Formamidopyrimidine-DNA glycosylase N-terminal domain-containing protein [Mycena maculata]
MPELPEVNRAKNLVNTFAGKVIEKVETVEDTIVFAGTTHDEFAKELTGRTVESAGRYGKVFYINLSGSGKMPVLHFGMTGMLQVRGELATYYKETPKTASTDWPPRFMKFILHLVDESGATTELAFLDARRLGRIRLCESPLTEPPISELGFDPILSMPGFEEYKRLVLKRSCPIKALLLDQSFSAGVGNWVADEILYNARIHPETRSNALTDQQLIALHQQTSNVCETAVSVDADDSKFPENWLFKHRWGKGKKAAHTLKLPSGEPATIKWITVGGRTSAYVVELQTLDGPVKKLTRGKRKPKEKEGDESDLSALTDSDDDRAPPISKPKSTGTPKVQKKRRKTVHVEPEPSTSNKTVRSTRARIP